MKKYEKIILILVCIAGLFLLASNIINVKVSDELAQDFGFSAIIMLFIAFVVSSVEMFTTHKK